MEDADQDTVSSPATPGAGKSKLDSLPKEDLIKFAKKQVFILQKVKSRCTELEKEVEELKSKQSAAGNEDVFQALTHRLDVVLLEKAEAQQQLVSLKKENCKIKQDATDAAEKTAQLQEQWDQLNSEHLKQIDCLKRELETHNFKHREEICRMEDNFRESVEQHTKLKNKLSLQNAREDEIKRLQEELRLLRLTYEDPAFQLKKELELLIGEKNLLTTKLQEVEKVEFKKHLCKIGHLKKELLKFRSVHRELASELVLKLDTYSKEHAEDIQMVNQLMQDIAEQYLEKEKSLQKELHENKVKYEQELLLLRKASDEIKENLSTSTEGQNISSELETQGKVKHLENILKGFDSQQSILRDELTYTKNVKHKLEVEVQHLKDEFFHEREELEFKINELQLSKEECTCTLDKLQSQLQSTNEQLEIIANEHSHEVLALKEQHKKDILDLKANLLSVSEQDKDSLVFEVQVLKEQCEKLKQEKEETICNYEALRETLVTLQDELGESAIKISQEFKAMKQQQATDVQELQQKLRTAYNEKDALLETVTRLNAEVERLSGMQSHCEELQQKMCSMHASNEKLIVSLEQKDTALKELEEKVLSLGSQNSNALSKLESCRNELGKLQDLYDKEKDNVSNLNHKIEVLSKESHELKQQYLKCISTLTDVETEKEKTYQKFSEMEKQIECFKHEKEFLLSEAKVHNDEIIKLNEVKHATTKDMEQLMSAIESGSAMKEQIENLQHKLQLANVKNEEICKSYETEQQQKLHNEQRLSFEVQGLCTEVGKLLEEKERMSRDLEQYTAERDSYLLIQEKVLNLQNNLQLANKEKEKFSKLFEEVQQQKLLLEENLSSQLQALRGEIVKMHKEKEKRICDIESSIAERDDSTEIKEQFEILQNRLQVMSVEKEELSKFHEEEMQKKMLTEERLLSEMQTLDMQVPRLLKDKEEMTRSIENFMAEQGRLCKIKEQVVILQNNLQLEIEEKEQLSKLVEKNEQQKLLLESRLDGFLLQIGHPPLDNENKENFIHTVLQAIGESITRLKEENNERCCLLQQNINRLRCDSESQCIEIQSLIEDFGKEKLHFQAELAATLSENETLQRDLLELRSASEKTTLENLDLLARVEEFSKRFEECGSEVKEQAKQLPETVQENLTGLLEQKESDLCNLKAEFIFLKDTMDKSMAVESDQQAAITELQMIIVNLEKVCKEKEEKSNKFKAVAVKAKKELDATRKEMQTLKEELELVRSEKNQLSSSLKDLIQGAESYKNLLVEYDNQAEQLDLAKKQANYSERQIEDLKWQLQAAYHQLDMANSEKEDFIVRVETLQSNTRLLESQILDLQRANTTIGKELEAEKLLKEQKIKDHLGVLKQLEEVQTQLQRERKQLQDAMHELDLVKKDAQKSTLMDMEMADYDRLVKELNQKISADNCKLEDLEQKIAIKKQKEETLQEEISSLQASVEQYEDRSMKMKQLLVKTKKDLADSKQAETDHLLLQASLKGELEASQQQGESVKIHVAEITAERHRLQEQLRASMEQQQRTANTFQQKIASLQDAYSIAKADQAAVTAEFEGYKVRVHNVLKQQKNKSSNHIEHDAARQEREHMEIILEQLKNKLHETQHNLHINLSELQTLQADHDTLLDRHNKMLQETVAKEAELREKLCTVQSENMVMKSEHAQILSQLTAQNEALRNSFRDQVKHMQEDHRKAMETLQQQLSKLETQLFQQRNESSITSLTSSQPLTKTLRDRRAADVPLLDMYITAREEGEGMETIDTDSVSSASSYLPPLEQLLNSPETKLVPAGSQLEPSKEELVQKLNTRTKSIDHLSGLLHETEATNAVLMEQITLLKSEVRRLERNQEREKSVNNLEYLKNVLLQFIFLKAGSERQRLLPVIDTMLQLSPEEKGKLVAIALGEEEAAARPAGWASYLHSWSGLR